MKNFNVMIVDDSVIFRNLITNSLKEIPGVEVSGVASSGKIALQKQNLTPADLIVLDLEMPEMDGLEVLRELKKKWPKTRVVIYSSFNKSSAENAINFLKEGADDIAQKPSNQSEETFTPLQKIKDSLIPKIMQFLPRIKSVDTLNIIKPPTQLDQPIKQAKNLEKNPAINKRNLKNFFPKIVVIASSTGGPNALEVALSKLKAPLKIPILIVQHMPPMFTAILAKRLEEACKIPCTEAKNNEVIENNHIYIAPGNFHMSIKGNKTKTEIILDQSDLRNSVRPAADFLFESAAEIFSDHCLGVVLTGMGQDGLDGARAIKEKGGGIYIQDKETSVVFGMPGAVFEHNYHDEIGPLENIAIYLRNITAI